MPTCPGQDRRFWTADDVTELSCPACAADFREAQTASGGDCPHPGTHRLAAICPGYEQHRIPDPVGRRVLGHDSRRSASGRQGPSGWLHSRNAAHPDGTVIGHLPLDGIMRRMLPAFASLSHLHPFEDQ